MGAARAPRRAQRTASAFLLEPQHAHLLVAGRELRGDQRRRIPARVVGDDDSERERELAPQVAEQQLDVRPERAFLVVDGDHDLDRLQLGVHGVAPFVDFPQRAGEGWEPAERRLRVDEERKLDDERRAGPGSDSARAEPPWAVATAATIERPSPAPPLARVRDGSAR